MAGKRKGNEDRRVRRSVRRVYEENGVQSRMKQDVMVSVIVPTYNHERYIRQALDSVIGQQVNFSMEILIGDDASTDNTLKIITEYKSKYPDTVYVIANKTNLGASKNSYNLVKHAAGKYIATLEGDDFWIDQHKLQTQVDFLEKHPQYIGCTHKFLLVDENGALLKKQKLSWIKQKKCFTINDFDGILMPGQPSTFVRRNIFREPKYDYSICYKMHRMISDRVALLFYLQEGNFYLLSRPMSCYRIGISPEAANITSIEYKRNIHADYRDFTFLCNMENYARNELNCNISFERTKYYIFARSLLHSIEKKNQMTDTIKILRDTTSPSKAVFFLPYNILKVLIRHLIYY